MIAEVFTGHFSWVEFALVGIAWLCFEFYRWGQRSAAKTKR